MLGYHINNNGVANSLGEVCQEPSYLDWLLDNHPDDKHKIFYDLDGSVASLLRLIGLNEKECQKLLQTDRVHLAGTPHHIFYHSKRVFGVDRGYGAGHAYANYYNAAQYQEVHYENGRSATEDGVEKAKEAAKVGLEVIRVYRKLGFSTDTLSSPVATLEKGMLSRLNIPTIDDIPEEAHTLAYGAVKANWLEAYKLGAWDKAYDFDLNGAYGFELSKLLDLRRGEWVEGIEKPSGAVYGFVEGYITTYADFHPFLLNTEGDMTYTPVGTWHTFLTMQELEFLYQYKLGTFHVDRGQWWIPKGQQNEIFKGLVQWLYNKRQGTVGIEREILHRAIAGIWGLTLQFKGQKFGNLFNPVYGAIVEANTRLKVAKACIVSGVNVLHIAVDGVITDLPLNVRLSDKMGDWRLSHTGKCIIAGCGAVAFEGKGGPEEFSLKYEWLRGELEAKPRARQYKMTKFAPVKLGEAVIKDRMSSMGCIEKATRTVYISADAKRIWRETPKNGGHLLSNQFESAPWEANIVLRVSQ